MHYNLKTSYFQCRWLKSNPRPSSLPPPCINHPSIPNSSCLLAFSLSISLRVYLIPPSFPPHTQKHTFYFSLSLPLSSSLSRVLEDLSKPGGRKSTFLPHQLAKPSVVKEQLKALEPPMLTANANVPFAKHEGQWAQAMG